MPTETLFHREATATDALRVWTNYTTGQVRVVSIMLINYSGTSATGTVWHVPEETPEFAGDPDDEYIVIPAVTVASGTIEEWVPADGNFSGILIEPGDSLWIKASAASSINVRVLATDLVV